LAFLVPSRLRYETDRGHKNKKREIGRTLHRKKSKLLLPVHEIILKVTADQLYRVL